MGEKKSLRSVQVFGRKKTSTAVAHCKAGKGLIKVNGRPLAFVEPRTLRQKVRCFRELSWLTIQNDMSYLCHINVTMICNFSRQN